MSYAMTRVNSATHDKMKDLAMKNGNTIIAEYERALDIYIRNSYKEILLENSKLETFLNEKLNKIENHLASMLARTGMDTSMNLMAMVIFLEKFFNGKYTREQLQDQLRREGARYFSSAIKKENKATTEAK